MDVITHECGHAFQGYISGKDPIREHSNITMETAEIHSMSMEYFTYDWMDKFFGDRKDDYLEVTFPVITSFNQQLVTLRLYPYEDYYYVIFLFFYLLLQVILLT